MDLLISAPIASTYGFLTGNKDLETRGDIVISDLIRLDDIALDTEGNAFLDLARSLPATKVNDIAPADVGLTPGKLDLLETRLETFNLLLGSPRTARGTKNRRHRQPSDRPRPSRRNPRQRSG